MNGREQQQLASMSLPQQALIVLIKHVSMDREASIDDCVAPLLMQTRQLNRFFYRKSEQCLRASLSVPGRFRVYPEHPIVEPLHHREGCKCERHHWGPIDSTAEFWRFDDFASAFEAFYTLERRVVSPENTLHMPHSTHVCQTCGNIEFGVPALSSIRLQFFAEPMNHDDDDDDEASPPKRRRTNE